MHDNDLDTFPEERERASTRIVITDDQLRSSWETFPTEETPPAPSPLEDTIEPQLSEPVAAPAIPQPVTPPVALPPRKRSRSFALAVVILALGVGVLAGQALVQKLAAPSQTQLGAPSPVERGASSEGQRAAAIESPPSVGKPSPAAPVAVEPPSVPRAASQPAAVKRADAGVTAPRKPARPPAAPVVAAIPPPPPAPTPPPAAAAPTVATAPPPAAIPAAVSPQPTNSASARVTDSPAAAAATVTPPAVAPPAVAPPAAAAPTIAAAAPALAPQTRAVLGTLYRYQEAFSTLDSNAAQQVWPDVDVRALDRAFDQLAQQTFDLRSCDVGIAGERAEAVCTGTASYARKVGNKAMRVESRRWRFTLRNAVGQWLIERVDVR